MKVTNIREAKGTFEVLQTTKRIQTAMMTLAPGESSGSEPEGHKNSDQVLLVLDGEVEGKIGEDKITMAKGDVIVIPAGTKHQFTNRSSRHAVTFNTYSPPEYRLAQSRLKWANETKEIYIACTVFNVALKASYTC
jgi:mannose-6-phosphate isomerase-like protein (cupin superfamily)